MRIHFIHGVRDDGRYTTGRLSRLVGAIFAGTGVITINHEFGRVRISDVWFGSARRKAKRLSSLFRDGDCIVCHSHGADISLELMKMFDIKCVVMLSPAVSRRVKFRSLIFRKLYCITNKADIAIWLGGLLPFHAFGWAGTLGFKTADKRVENIDKLSLDGPFNHSAPYFDQDNARTLSVWIADKVRIIT